MDAPVGGQGVFCAKGGEGRKHGPADSRTPKLNDNASIRASSGGKPRFGFARLNSSTFRKSCAVGLNSCCRAATASCRSLRFWKSSSLTMSGRMVWVTSSILVKRIYGLISAGIWPPTSKVFWNSFSSWTIFSFFSTFSTNSAF